MQRVLSRLGSGRFSVRPFIVGILFILFLLPISLWRLDTSTQGLGPHEYFARQNAQSVHKILESGVNAPYLLLLHASQQLHGNQIFYLRFTSVIIGLFVFLCLYKLLALGFGGTVAIFTCLIFITTPWLLLSYRSAETAVMWQWLIAVVSILAWFLRRKSKPGLVLILLSVLAAVSLYIPGLVWLLSLGLVIGRNRIVGIIKRCSRLYLVIGAIVFLLLVTPLLVALVTHPSNIRQLLLIPERFPSVLEILRSTAWSFFGIFWRTQSHIDIGIGRLPLLNIMEIALCIFGVYALFSRTRHLTYFLAAIVIFSIIAAGMNQNPEILLIGFPALIVFIAAGLRYLYLEWRRVFPLNPFARYLALALILVIVTMQISYGLRYSLVAWPDTEATKALYVLK